MSAMLARARRPHRPAVVPHVPRVDANGCVVNENAVMQQHVETQRSDIRPDSIKNVYDNKKKEYELYCEVVYPDDQFKYTVDADKTYAFLYYQAHRLQKKRGKPKVGVVLSIFNHTDYKEVMKKLTATSSSSVPIEPVTESTVEVEEIPIEPGTESTVGVEELNEPLNEKLNLPVGIEQMNHYKAMLKCLWKDQRQRNVNSFGWEQVWCNQHEELYLWVKSRKVSNYCFIFRVICFKVLNVFIYAVKTSERELCEGGQP